MGAPMADQSPPPLLTIIIPTLNEAEQLPALLADLRQQQGILLEIIIGDGGSSESEGTDLFSMSSSMNSSVLSMQSAKIIRWYSDRQSRWLSHRLFVPSRLRNPYMIDSSLLILSWIMPIILERLLFAGAAEDSGAGISAFFKACISSVILTCWVNSVSITVCSAPAACIRAIDCSMADR